MAATFTFYDSFTKQMMDAGVILSMNTIKCMLLSSAHMPQPASHDFKNDVEADEVAGAGYLGGGLVLTGKTSTLDTMAHLTKWGADDVVWDPVTFTNARYAVLYVSAGGMSSADKLIAIIDFGANESKSAGRFVIAWTGGVVFTLAR